MTLRRKSSGEPWNKIVSDWFQLKTIKVFLIGPFMLAREQVNVRRVRQVTTPGRLLISAISKQHLHD